jgi:hypothetical protein
MSPFECMVILASLVVETMRSLNAIPVGLMDMLSRPWLTQN